ncbi:uncharacterized protein LOC123271725 [Cotesia glomerata]|uniref:uncharacterized protein LOC123271725 n=1 Tax=Cotesia glomerata TaxID=32391 RepID=UPI001D01D7EF|nr:uncharacterized protein LOC123271725 [Cotesia glomerata]
MTKNVGVMTISVNVELNILPTLRSNVDSDQLIMRESKCLPKQLKGRCSKNSDCYEVKFAMCSNGQCACTAGFFAVNATCTTAVGGPCITNKDCTVRFSHCFEQTSKCNRNYIKYSESQCVASE